jgi:hypothetical protein
MTDVATEIAQKIITDAFDSCVPVIDEYIDDHIDTSQLEEDDLQEIKSQIVEKLERAAEYIASEQGILNV